VPFVARYVSVVSSRQERLGGLVSATVLNLFILPALYLSLRVSSVQELDLAPAEEGTAGGMSEAPAMGAD